MSKSSAWTRTKGSTAAISAAPPRREDADLAHAPDLVGVMGVLLVKCDADHPVIFQRRLILFAKSLQMIQQIADGDDAGRQLDLFLAFADLLAHPGKIDEPDHHSS